MTRINLIDPSELHQKHLVAEYREIVRVFDLARKCQHELHKKKIPGAYTLGTGHVTFFYDKLRFVSDRYDSLCVEMVNRGFTCNRIPKHELEQGIDKSLFWNYAPTTEAIRINRERISDRLPKSML